MIFKKSILVACIVLAAFSSLADDNKSSSGSIVVIVNKENPVDKLTSKELRKIFKGSMTVWKHGGRINAYNLGRENEARTTFSELIMKKSVDRVIRDYLRLSLSGKAQPPSIVADAQEMKKRVQANKKAIGYILAEDVDDTVKVITIDGKEEITASPRETVSQRKN